MSLSTGNEKKEKEILEKGTKARGIETDEVPCTRHGTVGALYVLSSSFRSNTLQPVRGHHAIQCCFEPLPVLTVPVVSPYSCAVLMARGRLHILADVGVCTQRGV